MPLSVISVRHFWNVPLPKQPESFTGNSGKTRRSQNRNRRKNRRKRQQVPKEPLQRRERKKKRKTEAKIETEEDINKIGEAELAQTEEAVPEEQPKKQADAPASLLSFADNSKLMWPVDGNVILNYSMDKSIYFETLNQYKYHPAIVIGAEEGTEVWCAARGEVSDIRVDEETGTIPDHGIGKRL